MSSTGDAPPAAGNDPVDQDQAQVTSSERARETDQTDPLSLIRKLLNVVVPTTALVSLLFYFGYIYSQSFYLEFGIDVDGLEFSTPEYLIRSANVVVDPVLIVAIGLIAAVILHTGVALLLEVNDNSKVWLGSSLAATFIVAGAALIALFTQSGTVGVAEYVADGWWLLGTFALLYGGYLLWRVLKGERTGARLAVALSVRERSAVAMMVLLASLGLVAYGLFELTRTYAMERGRQIAEWVETNCDTYPRVRIFSTVDLQITSPGVGHVILTDEENAFRHSYDELRQLNHDNGRYLVWPTSASPLDGVIVLADDERLRVEPELTSTPQPPCPISS